MNTYNFSLIYYMDLIKSYPWEENKYFSFELYNILFYQNYDAFLLNLIVGCVIIACVGKSAQVGLHLWLPEAMEGPTPVSSLIHAATMVTAGIYLVLKTSYLFDFYTLSILMMVGGVTAFFASSIGVFQNDIKKIIAYSTCSQLGYMVLACGLSGFNYGFFHLYIHAFFKALLFLTAGYVIHAVNDDQDVRKMGSLIYYFPFCYIMICYGSILLMGFPMTSGFYSKESIILLFKEYYFLRDNINGTENIFSIGNISSITFVYNFYIFFEWFIYISLIFTVWYSIKVLLLVFYYKNNNSRSYLLKYNGMNTINNTFYLKIQNIIIGYRKKKQIIKTHYSNFAMWFAIYELSDLSIFQGYICKDMFVGIGSDFFQEKLPLIIWNNYVLIFPFNFNEYGIENAFFVSFYMLLLFSILYVFFYKQLYLFSISFNFSILLIRHLSEQYLFYNKFIVNSILNYGLSFSYKFSYLIIEKGIVEWSGPFLIVEGISLLSNFLIKKKPHHVILYLGIMLLFINLFFFITI